MKEDEEPSGGSLVPSASSALTRKSTGLVRRGLDDLLKGQVPINTSEHSPPSFEVWMKRVRENFRKNLKQQESLRHVNQGEAEPEANTESETVPKKRRGLIIKDKRKALGEAVKLYEQVKDLPRAEQERRFKKFVRQKASQRARPLPTTPEAGQMEKDKAWARLGELADEMKRYGEAEPEANTDSAPMPGEGNRE